MQSFEKLSRFGLRDEQPAMLITAEAVGDRAVDHGDERIEVTGYVQQANRLAMQPELRPRQHLEQFLECAESSGKGHKAIGQLGHQRLPLVHVVCHAQVVDPLVQQFLRGEELWDNSDHVSVRGKNRIGDRSHQADAAASVDQFDPLASQQRPELFRRATMHGV